MRQRQVAWQMVAERAHRFGKVLARSFSEIMSLGVLADEKSETDVGQLFQQLAMPKRCALWSWRQVAGLAFAWIAETHRHQRYFVGIVKGRFVNTKPTAKLLAACIVPRNAALVHAGTRSLTDDEQTCVGMGLNHGASTMWKMGSAVSAGANANEERVQADRSLERMTFKSSSYSSLHSGQRLR